MPRERTVTHAKADAYRARRASGAGSNGASARAPSSPEEETVARLNREYAIVLLGSGPVVLRESIDNEGFRELRFMTITGFKEWLRTERVTIGRRPVSAADVWLNSPERRQFSGLCFAPGSETPGRYNLWQGWAVEPDPKASCQLFIQHIADNVCQGDEKQFAWVMGWFASIVQKPLEKHGTSLALRGLPGTGKTIVGRTIGALLEPHYRLVADPRYITGRFNSHLVDTVLLQADEGFWAGDHVAEGKLKDLITGEHQLIEFKGKEPVRVRNHVRLFITSNNDWVVPAGLKERRFTLIDVGSSRRNDFQYFGAIQAEMRSGGFGALMHYLLTFDCRDVPVRDVLTTDALLEQKISSLSTEGKWWLGVLYEGRLPGDDSGAGVSLTKVLYDAYLEMAKELGVPRRSIEVQLGDYLNKNVPGLERKRRTVTLPGSTSIRVYEYRFPSLHECRKAFEDAIGQRVSWPRKARDEADHTWGSASR